MDQNSIIKSYKRVSSIYDLTFGQVFRPGQKAIIKKMDCIESDNVLEIGIGTGSSLQYYPKETKVVGIDISPDMLEVAKKRIVKDMKFKLKDLKSNSVIGTSSFRREFQIKNIRNDINCKLIRGNVDTRIKKLKDGLYDGYGRFIYNQTVYYEGQWVKGKRHGFGTNCYYQGYQEDAKWEHDKLVKMVAKRKIPMCDHSIQFHFTADCTFMFMSIAEYLKANGLCD